MLSSFTGNLLTKILAKRVDLMCDNSLWKFDQCGFKQSTENNFFISNVINDKYINIENKTDCTAFVDFLKISNGINRQFLSYKSFESMITSEWEPYRQHLFKVHDVWSH